MPRDLAFSLRDMAVIKYIILLLVFATVQELVAMAETNQDIHVYQMSHGRHVHYG